VLRICLPSRFRRIFERFFTGQGKADNAKPKLLLGGLDEVPAENKPKRRWNGDGKQVLRLQVGIKGID